MERLVVFQYDNISLTFSSYDGIPLLLLKLEMFINQINVVPNEKFQRYDPPNVTILLLWVKFSAPSIFDQLWQFKMFDKFPFCFYLKA